VKRKESVWGGIFGVGVASFLINLFYQQFFRILNAYSTKTPIHMGKSRSGGSTIPNELEVFIYGCLFIGSVLLLGYMLWATIQIVKDKND
jgi:hypothetical protein